MILIINMKKVSLLCPKSNSQIDLYLTSKELGAGAFGKVYEAFNIDNKA